MLASPEQIIALDARVILHEPSVTADKLPKLAIRSYPSNYVTVGKSKAGKEITFRPIRPEDEPLLVKFHETLTERSVELRYQAKLNLQQRTAHERLIRICFNDYDRELAIVAEHHDAGTGKREIWGVGRLSKKPGTDAGEFALVVSDQHQKQGIGTQLIQEIVRIAKAEKLASLTATMLPENKEVKLLCERAGFKLEALPNQSLLKAVMTF